MNSINDSEELNPVSTEQSGSLMETSACTHYVKVRLLGRDPRLWECMGDEPGGLSRGCGALFVNGYTWHGEPEWIPVPPPLGCGHCLDGYGDYLLPVYPHYPDVCEKCGTSCRRVLKPEKTEAAGERT